ncbi:MAG: hypothetical protein JW854_01550 [Actinobacteria bacterium]|nr:hypothetical protein [Actinomycetota bacterium]
MYGAEGTETHYGMRLTICLLLMATLLAMSLIAPIPARGQEEQGDVSTGPIDPAAGAWIAYRGERTVPGQPEPQLFSLRVEYSFPQGVPQDEMVMNAAVTETNPAGQVVSANSFAVQTIDRSYRSQDGAVEGYWIYWLRSGLGNEDTATVEDGVELTADEEQDFDYKDNRFQVVRMRGDGIELLVERRTGLVFRIARDGGDTLQIEDTNMLAQYLSWWYCLDDSAVGSRLDDLANDHPDLVEVSSLGKSARGRDIWGVHITDFTSSEVKSSVVIDAVTEGDAPEGCEFLLDFLEELVLMAEEDEATAGLLSRLNIYAVPLVNPDGLQRWLAMPSPSESPLLSSQAPRNGNMVNINRNFDMKWEEGNRDPASADFAGPFPFSETESQVLRKLFEDVPADLYLSLHTGDDLINAPWNWSELPASNPEASFYESVLSELSGVFPYPTRVGTPGVPFTGSSTDWAYEGNGASSPICFDLYLHQPAEDEVSPDDGSLSSIYTPFREAMSILMENLHSFLAVDIIAPELRVEVNVPIDVTVEIQVNGKRALPDATARLILPEDSGLKFSSMAEKEVELGDLASGSSVKVTWNLEGKASGSNTANIILTSSYPEYERIPGTYTAEMEISVSTQRTWLVVVLLSVMVLLVLFMVLLSMRKHHRAAKEEEA